MTDVPPMIAIVERLLRDIDAGRISARQAIEQLVAEHGAVSRFADGTNHFRLGGVRTSSTVGGVGMLHNWLIAARRKIGGAR